MGCLALRLISGLIALTSLPGLALAHSDASKFGAPIPQRVAVDAAGEAGSVDRYPATVSVDPRRLVNVVVKINARIISLNDLYPGKRVREGDVLGELESAELETIQSSYLAIVGNLDAVQAFSMTSSEKLIDARMNLAWRGMSEDDIRRLETLREPLKTIRVRAPASGHLYSLDAVNNQILNTGGQVGQYTATGTTIATIMKPGAVQVETDLPVPRAAALRPGSKATVYLPSARRGQVGVPAVVEQVFAYVNPANQRQRARLKLMGALPDGVNVLPGQLASVSFGSEVHRHVH